MVTYHYRPPRIAQAQGQPENVLTWLRSLRRYLEVKEGARIIGCHRETFYGLIAAGCPAEKRGRRWRIDPIAFAAWLESSGFASSANSEPVSVHQAAGRSTTS